MDSTTLFVDLLLGVVGLAYLVYGRKQQHPMALISGMLLSIFPFFVSNLWLTLALGTIFIVAPHLSQSSGSTSYTCLIRAAQELKAFGGGSTGGVISSSKALLLRRSFWLSSFCRSSAKNSSGERSRCRSPSSNFLVIRTVGASTESTRVVRSNERGASRLSGGVGSARKTLNPRVDCSQAGRPIARACPEITKHRLLLVEV